MSRSGGQPASAGSGSQALPGPLGTLLGITAPAINNGRDYQQLGPAGVGNYNGFNGVCKLRDGRGLYLGRYGSAHQGSEGVLRSVYSTDATWRDWNAPGVLLAVSGRDLRDTSLLTRKRGDVVATYAAATSTSIERVHSIGLISSPDGVSGWSAHREDYTFDPYTLLGKAIAGITELDTERLIMPINGKNTGDTLYSTGVGISEGGLDPSSWSFVPVAATDGTASYSESATEQAANGDVLLAVRDHVAQIIRLFRSTDRGLTWANTGVTLDGNGRPTMYRPPSGSRIYMITRRGNGQIPILYWSDDHGATWAPNPTAFGLTTAGMTTDARWKSTNPTPGSPEVSPTTTAAIFMYGDMVEVWPGVTALAQCVEQTSGSEATLRWLVEKAAVAPGGGIISGGIVSAGARWNEPGMTFEDSTGFQFWPYFDSLNRLRLRTGNVPSSETSGAVVSWLRGSKTYDPPSVAAGAEITTTVTVTGAAVGDYATASFSLSLGGLKIDAIEVTATNTVTVTLRNDTAAAIDLASGTLRAAVLGA